MTGISFSGTIAQYGGRPPQIRIITPDNQPLPELPPLRAGDFERIFGQPDADCALDEAKRMGFVELPKFVAKRLAEHYLESLAVGTVVVAGGYTFRVVRNWWQLGRKELQLVGVAGGCFVAGTAVLLPEGEDAPKAAAGPGEVPDARPRRWSRLGWVSAALGLALLAGFYQSTERHPRRRPEELAAEQDEEDTGR